MDEVEATLAVVSELALYGFFYYLLYIFKVETNLLLSALILTAAINLAVAFSPALMWYKKH
ncbi:hypothetical protein GF336_06280 [Candidatus Woesearchaeota archaeon]|nr:hypothetical protein [Candidatus Woesearchaeota archaeon]